MRRFAVAAALFVLQQPQALACGYCIEDQMAAVYDHAAVVQAFDKAHQVAFFHIEGTLAPEILGREIPALAAATTGVDRESVRISTDPAAFALAFDPQRTSVETIQTQLQRRLAPYQVSLELLKVMVRPEGKTTL